MKQMSLTKVVIAASTFGCAALLSFSWSEQRGVSLSVESAQARVGRPLTPVSVAGVARRQTRRAVYGAGVVGAGAVAVGTAAAVAATSPNWGWGAGPYNTGTGYYAGGPYRARSFREPGRPTMGASIRSQHSDGSPLVRREGLLHRWPWYGYSGWNDYAAQNSIRCTPGSRGERR